jgi:hypothetical protein
MAKIDRPEAARRLARAIASDLSLYNEKKIIEGIEKDNLFELMQVEIQEGRDLYEQRVAEEIRESSNFFDLALVDILFKSKGHIESAIW